MSFRTVVITKHCKCSFKNDYMIIKDEQIQMIHLSEINSVIFETPAISITGVLLSELSKHKIGMFFCDEKHLPQGHYVSLTSNYISSEKIIRQAEWDLTAKELVWSEIVKQKIAKQSEVLLQMGKEKESIQLKSYIDDVDPGDVTNREGFAAKVYFNSLFGQDFVRRESSSAYNASLDYGYAILLAIVAREIVNNGYELALGIHHKGVFNPNNLACDIMEPFRPLVDWLIVKHCTDEFGYEIKRHLWNIGNTVVVYKREKAFLTSAISEYFRDVCRFIEEEGGCLPEYSFNYAE